VKARVSDPGEFGCLVRLRRRELGMTQQAIADVTGAHQTWISKLEKGGGGRLRFALLVAQTLGLNVELVSRETGVMAGRERTPIPTRVVVLLRGALYTELARACEDAPATMPEAHERSGWTEVFTRIDGARGALDAIGWDTTAVQDVTVVLDVAMIEALESDADLWDWLSRQEHLESVEGRVRARAKAEAIERFLAILADHPSAPKGGDA
jgi:transcriptional regulator with XRE-family HTH domain